MEDVSIILRAEEAAERTTRYVAELASDTFEAYSGSADHRGPVAMLSLFPEPSESRRTLGEGVDHEPHVGTD